MEKTGNRAIVKGFRGQLKSIVTQNYTNYYTVFH